MTPDRRVQVSLALVGLSALAGLALWPRLPAEMAIHFDAGGQPDTVVPRAVGVSLVPVVTLVTLAVLEGAFRADPPADPRTATVVVVATTALVAATHGLVLAYNVGYGVDVSLVVVGALVWAGAVAGYAVYRERSVTPVG